MKDPVFRLTKNEVSMATFQISVRRREPSRVCDYLDVIAWSGEADTVKNEYRAGSRIRITGTLRKNNFIGLDGRKHVAVQIIADEIRHPAEEDCCEETAETASADQLCAA